MDIPASLYDITDEDEDSTFLIGLTDGRALAFARADTPEGKWIRLRDVRTSGTSGIIAEVDVRMDQIVWVAPDTSHGDIGA